MDPHVRFVGIASREGRILGFRYRPGSMILKYVASRVVLFQVKW